MQQKGKNKHAYFSEYASMHCWHSLHESACNSMLLFSVGLTVISIHPFTKKNERLIPLLLYLPMCPLSRVFRWIHPSKPRVWAVWPVGFHQSNVVPSVPSYESKACTPNPQKEPGTLGRRGRHQRLFLNAALQKSHLDKYKSTKLQIAQIWIGFGYLWYLQKGKTLREIERVEFASMQDLGWCHLTSHVTIVSWNDLKSHL